MLFAISGSQGVGKSTLIEALSQQFPAVMRKTSRSILADWGVTLSEVNNDRALTIKFQDEILARKIADETEFVNSNNVYLTERTYADLFVYALVAIGKDNEYSEWLNDYYQRCLKAQTTYGGIIYLSRVGEFKPENDGVRAVNSHYSFMVDTMMYSYTHGFSTQQRDEAVVPIINIMDLDMDVRTSSVTNFIATITE